MFIHEPWSLESLAKDVTRFDLARMPNECIRCTKLATSSILGGLAFSSLKTKQTNKNRMT
jgi:hypothetical protein